MAILDPRNPYVAIKQINTMAEEANSNSLEALDTANSVEVRTLVQMEVYSTNGTTITDPLDSTLLVVTLFKGDKKYTEPNDLIFLSQAVGSTVSLVWYEYKYDEATDKGSYVKVTDNRVANGGFVLQLAPKDLNQASTYRCQLESGNKVITAIQITIDTVYEVSDTSDRLGDIASDLNDDIESLRAETVGLLLYENQATGEITTHSSHYNDLGEEVPNIPLYNEDGTPLLSNSLATDIADMNQTIEDASLIKQGYAKLDNGALTFGALNSTAQTVIDSEGLVLKSGGVTIGKFTNNSGYTMIKSCLVVDSAGISNLLFKDSLKRGKIGFVVNTEGTHLSLKEIY